MKPGPKPGTMKTPEHLEKIRLAKLASPYKHSAESRQKMSDSLAKIRDKMSIIRKGAIHTTEHRNKISASLKGHPSWNKGIPMSEEAKEKIRQKLKGKPMSTFSEEARIVRNAKLKERIFTPEWKRKISEAIKNKPIEYRQKIAMARKDWVMPLYAKQKISLKLKGRISGDKNPCWNGGISFQEYGIDFNDDLKLNIRQRDNFTCAICQAVEKDRPFPVHHINYNKRCNIEENLILLCSQCHSKTNFNRDKWKSILIQMQELKLCSDVRAA